MPAIVQATYCNTYSDFVAKFQDDLIELLKPVKGEKILDLGCGTGNLSRELLSRGVYVTSVDSTPSMVKAAMASGVDAILADEATFESDKKFDAIVSNFALHWIDDQFSFFKSANKLLRIGGRLAVECGGSGCVRIIREGLKLALQSRGLDYKSRNPWKFPGLDETVAVLESHGFRVQSIGRYNCPIDLSHGIRLWLEVFAESHVEGMSAEEKNSFYEDVEEYCLPMLYDKKTQAWTADYVRLRFLATKE